MYIYTNRFEIEKRLYFRQRVYRISQQLTKKANKSIQLQKSFKLILTTFEKEFKIVLGIRQWQPCAN